MHLVRQSVVVLGVVAVIGSGVQAFAQDKSATLYMDAVALPKKAKVCAVKQADFQPRFDAAFAKWRAAHQAELAQGERALRAQAKASNQVFPANVESETDTVAQMFQATPDAALPERCAAVLAQLAAK
jgi:hypothetical protein